MRILRGLWPKFRAQLQVPAPEEPEPTRRVIVDEALPGLLAIVVSLARARALQRGAWKSL
jgi:hypothetical protein